MISVTLLLVILEFSIPFFMHDKSRLHDDRNPFGTNPYSKRDLQRIYGTISNQEETRLAVVGDSFTEGIDGLSTNFPAELQRELREVHGLEDISVLNLGGEGRNLLDYYLYFKDGLRKFYPDYVLFLITANDTEFYRWNYNPFFYCPNATDFHKRIYRLVNSSELIYFLYDSIARPLMNHMEIDFFKECNKLAAEKLLASIREMDLPIVSVFFNSKGFKKDYCQNKTELEANMRKKFSSLYPEILYFINEKIPCKDGSYQVYLAKDHYHFNEEGIRLKAKIIGNYLAPTLDNKKSGAQ